MLEAYHKYGPLRRGTMCKQLKEGYDWCAVRLRGKVLFVPKWVFSQEGMEEERDEEFLLESY